MYIACVFVYALTMCGTGMAAGGMAAGGRGAGLQAVVLLMVFDCQFVPPVNFFSPG